MRIGMISDPHAVPSSLGVAIDKMNADALICAGDLAGYGYNTDGVVELLQKHDALVVKGNHDVALVKGLPVTSSNFARRLLDCTVRNTSDSSFEYISKLPERIDVVIDGISFAILHGTPKDHITGRFDEVDDLSIFRGSDVFVIGHTHHQFIAKSPDSLIISPGSCGFPRDSLHPSFFTLDTETMMIKPWRL